MSQLNAANELQVDLPAGIITASLTEKPDV